MKKKFYLTTPLYYVNDVPHVGHTYSTVVADAIVRYKRMCGFDVCFLTGTDEHGLKLERAAGEQGVTPQQLVDTFAGEFEKTWKSLGVSFDQFIRTSEDRHHQAVADIFQRIKKNGFISTGKYEGYYCVRCESYVPEGEKTCSDCGRPTEFMTEESYFFKLSALQEELLDFYADNPEFVLPGTRMNEVVSFVKGGLQDISISRTSFSWGIPVPDDEKHIFYVWFDALTGYLSGAGYGSKPEQFEEYWPADVHLIGKDILRFHAVYWPAFLMAAGLEPPRHVLTHGWWTVAGEKMSKSRGNFITTGELMEVAEADCVKYFLMREISLGADGNFSYDGLLTRINSDLANDLGNSANRTLKMIQNYFDGAIPELGEAEGGDSKLREFSLETIELYKGKFDQFQINQALDRVWELISILNKYLVANQPWMMAKDPAKRDRLGTVLYNSAEALRLIAVMLSPVIPSGASSILGQLGVSKPLEKHQVSDLTWGRLKSGSAIGEIVPVYPRLDPKEFQARIDEAAARRSGAAGPAPDADPAVESQTDDRVGIDEFARIDMRVGKVLSAEALPKSKRLLKLQVDLGSEVRQIVAGIAEAYTPESLSGRFVVIVANLKPARLMGVESNGMIVAASDGDRPVLVTPTEPVQLGSRLK